MKLEELGSKTELKVSSDSGVYNPLKLKMATPGAVDFEGNLDVVQLLATQVDMLKTRNNKFVSDQLVLWAQALAGRRAIVSVSQGDHQVTCEKLGSETLINGSLFDNGIIQCEIYLPTGVVCESNKPMEEMGRALGVLRRRIADEYDVKLAEYKQTVNVRACAIDASMLGLDLDLDIGTAFSDDLKTSPEGGVFGDGGEPIPPLS
jgi:hypothetical protein